MLTKQRNFVAHPPPHDLSLEVQVALDYNAALMIGTMQCLLAVDPAAAAPPLPPPRVLPAPYLPSGSDTSTDGTGGVEHGVEASPEPPLAPPQALDPSQPQWQLASYDTDELFYKVCSMPC